MIRLVPIIILLCLSAEALFAQLSKPVLRNVTVNVSNNAELNWEVHPDPLVQGYIIYQVVGTPPFTTNEVRDTVMGRLSTNWENTNSQAASEVETYKIIASYLNSIDDSGFSDEHHTVLHSLEIDDCSGEVTMRWNAYDTWPDGIANYQLIGSEDGGAPQVFATIAGTETSGKFSGITSGSNYIFWIKAVSRTGKESESNRISIKPKFISFPTSAYISNVRPSGNQSIRLEVHIEGTAQEAVKVAYKDFGQGKEVVFSMEGPISSAFPDVALNGDKRYPNQPYSLFMEITNQCPGVLLESNKMEIGVITLDKSPGQIQVSVGEVNGFENGVGETKIYKVGIDPNTLKRTYTLLSNTSSYLDTDVEGTQHCYVADVSENGVNSLGIQGEVRLFPQCSFDVKDIDFPNVFSPGGSVPTFNPFFTLNGFFTGSLKIYDRYGGEIFSEEHSFENPGKGWDGSYKGKKVPPGAYIYFMNFIDDIQRGSYMKTGVVYIF